MRLRASDTLSDTTPRLATVEVRRFCRAPRSPRPAEILSRMASATSIAVLAPEMVEMSRLRSVFDGPLTCPRRDLRRSDSAAQGGRDRAGRLQPNAAARHHALRGHRGGEAEDLAADAARGSAGGRHRDVAAVGRRQRYDCRAATLAVTPLTWELTASTNCCRRRRGAAAVQVDRHVLAIDRKRIARAADVDIGAGEGAGRRVGRGRCRRHHAGRRADLVDDRGGGDGAARALA